MLGSEIVIENKTYVARREQIEGACDGCELQGKCPYDEREGTCKFIYKMRARESGDVFLYEGVEYIAEKSRSGCDGCEFEDDNLAEACISSANTGGCSSLIFKLKEKKEKKMLENEIMVNGKLYIPVKEELTRSCDGCELTESCPFAPDYTSCKFIYKEKEMPVEIDNHRYLLEVIGRGLPTKVHKSRSAADTEARRLAMINPGKSVFIYTVIGEYKAEEPKVEFKTL